MVLGPGPMDWNIVSCNASSIPKLVDSLFFNHNDWVEPSFHNIDLGWFDFLLYYSSPPRIEHYCFDPLMQPFFFPSPRLSLLPFVTVSISRSIALDIIAVIPWCTHFLISPSSFVVHICLSHPMALLHMFLSSFHLSLSLTCSICWSKERNRSNTTIANGCPCSHRGRW